MVENGQLGQLYREAIREN